MKKKVTTLTIVGLLFLLIAFGGFIGLGFVAIDGTAVYDPMQMLAQTGQFLTQQFTNMTVMTFVNLGIAGLFLILLIVQICMAIKKKHGPAAAISITTLIGMALIFFFITYYFIPGVANDQFGIITLTIALLQAGKWLGLIYFIPALFFVIGFILMLAALISDMKLLAELPDPRLDSEPADDIMVIHDEDLESEESAASAREALSRGGYDERHGAEMFPPAPGIQGPLLVQYINTYAPTEPAAGKKNTVPVTEIQGAITGEKPLTPEDIRKIIQEEIGASKDQPVIVNVPATPKEPEGPKGLTAEEVRAIISEEIGRYLTAEEPEEEEEPADIYVEPEPEASLSAEDIRAIIASELAKAKEEPEPVEEEKPVDVREAIREELEAHRRELEEEARRREEEEEAERLRLAEEARREELRRSILSADDVRAIISEELSKKGEPEPEPVKEEPELTLDLIREVIRAELRDAAPVKEEKVPPVTVVLKDSEPEPVKEEPKPEIQMPVVNIIVKSAEPVAEPAPEPEPEPEPAPAPEPEPEPEPVRAVGEVNPDLPPHDKIIRIPFPTRMLDAEKDLKDDYNELKSEILSYGVKSRVSNTGDTFRLHKVTFVKITIAGKGLKLYFALDPKDYENSTLPIQDAGHKGIYRDIPLVFKVKSELSLRRAKQLITDVMEKNGLEQGKIEPHDWAADLKDFNGGADGDDD